MLKLLASTLSSIGYFRLFDDFCVALEERYGKDVVVRDEAYEAMLSHVVPRSAKEFSDIRSIEIQNSRIEVYLGERIEVPFVLFQYGNRWIADGASLVTVPPLEYSNVQANTRALRVFNLQLPAMIEYMPGYTIGYRSLLYNVKYIWIEVAGKVDMWGHLLQQDAGPQPDRSGPGDATD